MHALASGKMVQLSAQNIIDCSSKSFLFLSYCKLVCKEYMGIEDVGRDQLQVATIILLIIMELTPKRAIHIVARLALDCSLASLPKI